MNKQAKRKGFSKGGMFTLKGSNYMYHVGAFKSLLPFSAAFENEKMWLEMLPWTYMYISICVKELNKTLKFVSWKFQTGDCF